MADRVAGVGDALLGIGRGDLGVVIQGLQSLPGADQLQLGAGDRSIQALALVELGDGLPGFDALAFSDGHIDDGPAHVKAQVDGFDRRQLALDSNARLADDGGDRGGLLSRRRGALAGAQDEGQGKENYKDCGFDLSIHVHSWLFKCSVHNGIRNWGNG